MPVNGVSQRQNQTPGNFLARVPEAKIVRVDSGVVREKWEPHSPDRSCPAHDFHFRKSSLKVVHDCIEKFCLVCSKNWNLNFSQC
jgi:hypothetical protein